MLDHEIHYHSLALATACFFFIGNRPEWVACDSVQYTGGADHLHWLSRSHISLQGRPQWSLHKSVNIYSVCKLLRKFHIFISCHIFQNCQPNLQCTKYVWMEFKKFNITYLGYSTITMVSRIFFEIMMEWLCRKLNSYTCSFMFLVLTNVVEQWVNVW